MQTQTADKRVIVRDGDGNFYAIPEYRHREFISLKEEQIQADHGSSEWYQVTEILATEFAVYMKD